MMYRDLGRYTGLLLEIERDDVATVRDVNPTRNHHLDPYALINHSYSLTILQRPE